MSEKKNSNKNIFLSCCLVVIGIIGMVAISKSTDVLSTIITLGISLCVVLLVGMTMEKNNDEE